jgi:hypothetical protein
MEVTVISSNALQNSFSSFGANQPGLRGCEGGGGGTDREDARRFVLLP